MSFAEISNASYIVAMNWWIALLDAGFIALLIVAFLAQTNLSPNDLERNPGDW